MKGLARLYRILSLSLLSFLPSTLQAVPHFNCAGYESPAASARGAAKSLATLPPTLPSRGRVHVLVVFAQFADEADQGDSLPNFAGYIFDPEHAGSFSHFYDTMSSGQLQVGGTVLPKRYSSDSARGAYLAKDANHKGDYGRFVREILRQVDADHDLGAFDNDGSDGVPNSGDDDGVVDYLFVLVRSTPRHFLKGGATGIAGLGMDQGYRTEDATPAGSSIRLGEFLSRSAIVRVANPALTIASMAHEFGHSLGLPDLYDRNYEELADDSAGIGRWGLMGWGAQGWNGDDGPNPMCAWSREQLGWIGRDNERLVEVHRDRAQLEMVDLHQDGFVYKVALPAARLDAFRAEENYLLLEYRARNAHYYNRHLPAEGLLVWHVYPKATGNGEEGRKLVDLVCADGLYADAGYPLGQVSDPHQGRDNLDFWSHDPDYATLYGGNMGDATDVFDGVSFKTLDLGSNPSTRPGGVPGVANSGVALHHMRRRGEGMVLDLALPRWAGIIGEQVHWMGEVIVDGDLTIAPEGQLVVHKRTRVRFAGTDRLQAGADPARCELRVQGRLKIKFDKGHNLFIGEDLVWVEPQPVVFEGLVPGASWSGIFPEASALLKIPEESLVLRDAEYGLLAPGAGPLAASVNAPTAIFADTQGQPADVELLPNYPNPFNPETTMPYVLSEWASVRLTVYNALGQIVRTLVDREQAAGVHKVIWDGVDEGGREVASGRYLYRLEVAGQHVQTRQMVVLR